jgi:hypothetical protein
VELELLHVPKLQLAEALGIKGEHEDSGLVENDDQVDVYYANIDEIISYSDYMANYIQKEQSNPWTDGNSVNMLLSHSFTSCLQQ